MTRPEWAAVGCWAAFGCKCNRLITSITRGALRQRPRREMRDGKISKEIIFDKMAAVCICRARESSRPEGSNGIGSRRAPSGQETRSSRRKGHHPKRRDESQRVSRAHLIQEVAEQARQKEC